MRQLFMIAGKGLAAFFMAIFLIIGWRELRAGMLGVQLDLSLKKRLLQACGYWLWKGVLSFAIAALIAYFAFVR
jgi:hypothetical protein